MEKRDRKKFLRIVLISSIVILTILSVSSVRKLFILASFVVINYIFAYLKRKIPIGFIRKYFYGIELVLFCTVITSVTFGSIIGAFMGALLIVANYIAERRISDYALIITFLYLAIGYASYFFRDTPIVLLGTIITIVYNLLAFILSKIKGANLFSLAVFNLINIAFNLLLFNSLGNFVLLILS
ncbi:MAG: hypothetical protein ABIJ34_01310 [archaeon]